jgi:2-polyprenyl-6-methoxyphenol hydroxylase-like FAD-dependent oxidoreductase
LQARVVVGADGRNSAVAKLAGVKALSSDNCRFAAFRSYRDVPLRRGNCSQIWFRGTEVGYVFPNDNRVTVIAYMATKDKLDEFRGDANTALERSLSRLPDYPDLSAARALGDAILVKDFPNLWRDPTVGSIAFVGDALMSIDPLWGVGCGFAFQASDWLVEAVAPALKQGQPPASALKQYSKKVERQFRGHRFLINDYARRRGFNVLERLTFSAAAKNKEFSQHLHAFGARIIGPARFLSPAALLRAMWINLTRSASPSAEPNAPSNEAHEWRIEDINERSIGHYRRRALTSSGIWLAGARRSSSFCAWHPGLVSRLGEVGTRGGRIWSRCSYGYARVRSSR